MKVELIVMVKFEGSINAQGKLYLPIEIRNALGKKVELLGNATALVIYPKGTNPHDVLESLGVITHDLRHRQSLARRKPSGVRIRSAENDGLARRRE